MSSKKIWRSNPMHKAWSYFQVMISNGTLANLADLCIVEVFDEFA